MSLMSHETSRKSPNCQQETVVVIRCKSFGNDTMEAVKGKICCCLFSPLDKFIVSSRYKYRDVPLYKYKYKFKYKYKYTTKMFHSTIANQIYKQQGKYELNYSVVW